MRYVSLILSLFLVGVLAALDVGFDVSAWFFA